MEKEPFDAGDEVSVGKRKTKAQLKKEQEVEELKQVLSTKAGMNVIWRILAKTGPFEGSFTGNSTTFFKEGRRSIGLEIITEINEASPRAFALMQLAIVDKEKD